MSDKLINRAELLILKMQFFWLDPSYHEYITISECQKLKNAQGSLYDLWNQCVLAKYDYAKIKPSNTRPTG